MDTFWTVKIFAKNECFYPEQPENKEIGFIIRGAVKVYREYRGKQQIVALLREGQLNTIKPHFAVFMQDSYTCFCVENTIMVTIDEQKLTRLLIEKPFFSTFFKNLNEHLFVYLESRLSSFQLMSAQQRYDDLLNNQPDLLIRFSLNDIANYLGIERETLSRIRNMANHRDRLFRQVK
jgi:CRP-like cAMP-binding protein